MKRPLPDTSTQVSETAYAYLEERVASPGRMRVLMVGREKCDSAYLVERPSFPCFGLEFVAAGTGRLEIDGNSFPIQPGSIFCYGPRTSHRISGENGPSMTKYFVDFMGGKAADVFPAGKIQPGQIRQVSDLAAFQFLFEQMIRSGGGDLILGRQIAAQCLRLIILKTAEAVTGLQGAPSATVLSFFRCRSYIEKHYLRLQSLNDLASELRLHPGHLCRVFKQMGQPRPFRYLTAKKMARAVELLVGGRMAVKVVAQEVGYNDPYHFSRLFKSHFGLSPAHFAKFSRRTSGAGG